MQSTSLNIKAIDEFPKNLKISDRELENIQNKKLSETGNLANILRLKVDAQVMLLSNIDIEDRLVNGLLGQVKDFKIVSGGAKVIYVKFDNATARRNLMHSDAIGRSNSWVPIHRIEVTFGLRKNWTHPCVKRTQIPLTLASACTVHKLQGLSLDTGVISFDLHEQKYFNQCQMYVALSRIKSLENLFLIGTYAALAIIENVTAKLEYERMSSNQIKFLQKLRISDFSITITLLNISSIKGHMLNVLCDQHLIESDFL